MTKNLDN